MAIKFKKILKFFSKLILVLLVVIFILLMLLRMPAVQTQLAKVATNFLAKKIGTEVSIEKVAINFIDNVRLKGIYLEDEKGGTLLSGGNLEVDLQIFELLSKKVTIQNVVLENSKINIYQKEDSTFSYQFIMDALASTDTTTSSSPFEISVGQIQILEADYNLDLLQAKNKLKIKELFLELNTMDVYTLFFDVKELNVDGAFLSSIWEESVIQDEINLIEKEAINFPLEGLPISVICEKLNFINSSIIYEKKPFIQATFFDPNFIHLDDFNMHVKDIFVNDSIAGLEFNSGKIYLNEAFFLDDLKAKIFFTEKETSIEKFQAKTKNSSLDLAVKTNYDSFNDLTELNFSNFELLAQNSTINIEEALYFISNLDSLNEIQNIKNETVSLSANLIGNFEELNIHSLDLSLLQTNVNLSGVLFSVLNLDEIIAKDLNLKAQTNTKDLRQVLGSKIIKKTYDTFGGITLNTKLYGSINNLNLSSFNLNTSSKTKASLSGKIMNVLDVDKLAYSLSINELKTAYKDAAIFTNDLPEMLKQFTSLVYKGKLKGDVNTFDLKGSLLSNLGSVNTDLFMDFNKDYTNASYKGAIDIPSFNLGKLLSNDSLGSISLDLNFDGKGLSLDDVETSLEGKINTFNFNGYTYENVIIDGQIIQKEFIGNLSIDDKNLAFDFEGLVNFNDSIPVFDFKANLENINTQELKLTKFPLKASLEIESRLSGIKAKDIIGDLVVKNIVLDNDTNRWQTDSITFKAEDYGKNRVAYFLRSSFLEAELTGRFDVVKLPQIMAKTIDEYFPLSNFVSESTPFELSNEEVYLNVFVSKPNSVTEFFNLDLKQMDTANLHFYLDVLADQLEMEMFIPEILYGDVYIDSTYFFSSSIDSNLLSKLSIDSVGIGEIAYIPGISSQAVFENKNITVTTKIEDANNNYSLNLKTLLKADSNNLNLDILSPFILNAKEWNVNQSNSFSFSSDELIFPRLQLTNQNESLLLNYKKDVYSLDFQNFAVQNFLDLVQMDSTTFKGLINGEVELNTSLENLLVSGDLNIDDIYFNDLFVGNLKLKATKDANLVDVNFGLKGGDNDLRMTSKYDANSGEIKGYFNLVKFNVVTLAPFVNSYAKNMDGSLSGQLKVTGNVKQLELGGNLKFDDLSAFLIPAGTKYSVSEGAIIFSPNKISPNLVFRDDINRKSYLKGAIEHRYFSDFTFDLTYLTEAFTFLNSKKKEEELFFGKLVAKANLSITGDVDLPIIRGNVGAIDESDLTVQILSAKDIASQEDYVIFINGSDLSNEEMDSLADNKYQLSSNIDLNVNIDVDDKAIVRVIIDPLTGDNLEIKGNGQLNVKIPPNGEIDITGVYTVKEGQYRFSFQKFLKKKFEIVAGSQITFAGNPLNATMNIQAAYNTDAVTYALVENDISSLSDSEQQSIKKKSEVSVLLNVKGKLSEPDLKFDIAVKEEKNSPTGSAVTRALNSLKQDESELNKQVFSLLLFNSFTGSSSSGNISSAGTSTALRSVGNLINSQLNRLAGNAKGLQINFDLDQYEDQLSANGEQITDIELGLSQSLFNDKVVISVGGNVGLESGQTNDGALSNVAGDFVLEYKITSDGKYVMKVFQKSDYDALNDANVWKTGAGFSYQTKFGRLNKVKKKK